MEHDGLLGKMGSPAPLLDPIVSVRNDSDWHVLPENAEPIHGIPVADAVTNANLLHVFIALVREGKTATRRVTVSLNSLIAIQRVVDRQRVLKHEIEWLETGSIGENPPLVQLWDGDYFFWSGHHGLQAAYNLGVPAVEVDLIVASD